MTENAEAFWALAAPLIEHAGVDRSTMMGLPCLRINGAFFASYDAKTESLILKLPAATVEMLIDRGEAQPFAPAGRRFKEWAGVPATHRAKWAARLDEALAHVASLPTTPSKKRSWPGRADAGFDGSAFAFVDHHRDDRARLGRLPRFVRGASILRPFEVDVDAGAAHRGASENTHCGVEHDALRRRIAGRTERMPERELDPDYAGRAQRRRYRGHHGHDHRRDAGCFDESCQDRHVATTIRSNRSEHHTIGTLRA